MLSLFRKLIKDLPQLEDEVRIPIFIGLTFVLNLLLECFGMHSSLESLSLEEDVRNVIWVNRKVIPPLIIII